MAWYGINTLQIRSKNSAGTVLHTYAPLITPGAGVHVTGGLVEVTKDSSNTVVEQRETIGYAKRSIVRGIYPTINVTLDIANSTWSAAAGYTILETVLGERFGTNYLEISLNSGSTWTRVSIEDGGSDVESKLEGKNVGLHREISFLATDLVSAEVSAGSGGL